MEILEVADILGLCHALIAPKHIFIVPNERIFHKSHGKTTFFRGLQPKNKGDACLIGGLDADETTPIHETIHANFGLGEPGTEILTRLIMAKRRITRNFPNLQRLTKRRIQYEKVEGSDDYPRAHVPEYEGRVIHYVRIR